MITLSSLVSKFLKRQALSRLEKSTIQADLSIGDAGKPARLWNTIQHLTDNQWTNNRPTNISILQIGDSVSVDMLPFFSGRFPIAGNVVGSPNQTLAGSAALTTPRTEYAKTPWGCSVVLPSSGASIIFGPQIASSTRFTPGRYLTVHYEAVTGGGSFKVQKETSDNTWVDVATIDTNVTGASTYTVWNSSALSAPISTRIKLVWVSGSCAIYAAGVALNLNNTPDTASDWNGVCACNTSMGGSYASQWDTVPQAVWNTLLANLQTNVVIIRELMDDSAAIYKASLLSLIAKLKIAKSRIDIVIVGTHPTPTGTDTLNIAQDAASREICDSGQYLFVDVAKEYPATYAEGLTIGFNESGSVHLNASGYFFVGWVTWKYLAELENWMQTTHVSGTQPGIKWDRHGVQGSFRMLHNPDVEDVVFGTITTSGATAGPVAGWQEVFHGTSATKQSGGYSRKLGSYYVENWDTAGRSYRSVIYLPAVSKNLLATEEINGYGATHALIVSAPANYADNIFEVKTESSQSLYGTCRSGADKLGRLFSNAVPTYADDAAATADTDLPAGGFYKVTGSTVLHVK